MKIPFPLAQVDGQIADQPADEVWVRSGDYVGVVAERIWDQIQGDDGLNIVKVAAIGAKAVNQTVKAIAIVRNKVRDNEWRADIYCTVYFSTIVDGNGEDRTRMVFVLLPIGDDVIYSLHL